MKKSVPIALLLAKKKYFANTGHVGPISSDCTQSGDKFMVIHFQIIDELFSLQVPDK
jgi:hypothetical protein